MRTLKKKIVVFLCFFIGIFFAKADMVAADENVTLPYTMKNTAVFYLSDEAGSTIYRYEISGFADTSPTDETYERYGKYSVPQKKNC